MIGNGEGWEDRKIAMHGCVASAARQRGIAEKGEALTVMCKSDWPTVAAPYQHPGNVTRRPAQYQPLCILFRFAHCRHMLLLQPTRHAAEAILLVLVLLDKFGHLSYKRRRILHGQIVATVFESHHLHGRVQLLQHPRRSSSVM